jgi:DNA-binding NarL/FixJ family response regulator
MKYVSVGDAAERWGVDPRAVQRYCAAGKIRGAKKYGRAWMVPDGAERPPDNRKKAGDAPPPLYPGLFLMENLRLDGRSPEEIAAELPDDECRREFFWEFAFLQGKTRASIELSARMPQNSRFRMTVLHGRNIAAIRRGRYDALCRSMDALNELRIEYREFPAALSCIELANAVVYASIYAPYHCPEWLQRGDFSGLPADAKPFALYLYTLYLNSAAQPQRMLGVTEAALAQTPSPGFTVAELYLRIMRVNALMTLDKRDQAREQLVQALEEAVPYGLFSPFSEHLATMRGLLEEVARKRFPEAHKQILKGWKEVFSGWTEIHNRILDTETTKLLTAREYQIALFLVDGRSYKEIADRMNTTLAGINYSLQVIREKLGVKKSRDIVRFVSWCQNNNNKT